MRAGRLLSLLLLLQHRGRMTTTELAGALEVSPRTVLRDLEVLSGAGVPVYAVRGRFGGFELLDTFRQTVPDPPPGLSSARGRLRRVRVRVSPAALQRALVTGKPDGWRPRPSTVVPPDQPDQPDPRPDQRPDWIEGSFRFDSDDVALRELLGFGDEVEVLLPLAMRDAFAAIGRRIVDRHS